MANTPNIPNLRAIRDWIKDNFQLKGTFLTKEEMQEYAQPKGDYLSKDDMKDYALSEDAGYKLVLNVDQTTYVMNIQLRNKLGQTLSSQEFDFPIESAFVGVRYNKATNEITFVLQNGVETEPIDISHIVAGLVKDTFTIAGLNMKEDITANALKIALNVPSQASDIGALPIDGVAESAKNINLVELSAGADLNNIINSGGYICRSTAIAQQVLNNPVNVSFTMFVQRVPGNYVKQILFPYNTNQVYNRIFHETTKEIIQNWQEFCLKNDLNNYLPLSGGTINGNVNVTKLIHANNYVTHYAVSGKHNTGYHHIAILTVHESWCNFPVMLEIARRGDNDYTRLIIRFENVSSLDPNVEIFRYITTNDREVTRQIEIKMARIKESVWNLYVKKADMDDEVHVVDFHNWYNANPLSIEWVDNFVLPSELPGNCIDAVRYSY